MDALTRFVSDQNIARFVEALRLEIDPGRRLSLRRLLTEEIYRFGLQFELLQVVDRHLTDGAVRIESQKQLVENARSNGADPSQLERKLNNLVGIQEMFFSFRAKLIRGVETVDTFEE